MAKKQKLSKSGYYEYLKRKICRQKIRKARITERIKEIHKDSKEIYGAPKITRRTFGMVLLNGLKYEDVRSCH